MTFRRRLMQAALSAFVALAAACGGGGDDSSGPPTPPTQATPARLEITPGSQMLTAAGQTHRLTATAFDANNAPIPRASVTWATSNDAMVSVAPDGTVTAMAGLGSARITATAGAARASALVSVVQPAAGTVMLRDEQIVRAAVSDPNATWAVGMRYTATLTDVAAPAVGSVVMSAQDKPVSGRVLAVSSSGNEHTVTLELVPLDDLFTAIDVRETVRLADLQPTISEAVRQSFDVSQPAPGVFRFSLKPGTVLRGTSAGGGPRVTAPGRARKAGPSVRRAAPFKVGPLDCELTGSPAQVELSKLEFDIDVSGLSFDNEWNATRKALLLTGTTKHTVAFNPKVSIQGAAALECKAALLPIPLPVSGPMGLLAKTGLVLGPGLAFDAKFPVSDIGFEVTEETDYGVRVGLECAPECSAPRTYEVQGQPKRESKIAALAVPEGVKFEGSAYGFGFVDLVVGPSRPARWVWELLADGKFRDLEWLGAKAGLKFEVRAASQDTQAADSNYKSDYKALVEVGIGTGKDLTAALRLLQLPFTAFEFKVASDLATSPTGTLSASKENFVAGDEVALTVQVSGASFDLSGGTVAALNLYNIDTVRIMRRVVADDGSTFLREVASLPVQAPQTEFTTIWLATDTGRSSVDLVAFVTTKALPTLALELSQSEPNTGTWVGTVTATYGRTTSHSATTPRTGDPIYYNGPTTYNANDAITASGTWQVAVDVVFGQPVGMRITGGSGSYARRSSEYRSHEYNHPSSGHPCVSIVDQSSTASGTAVGGGGELWVRQDGGVGISFGVEFRGSTTGTITTTTTHTTTLRCSATSTTETGTSSQDGEWSLNFSEGGINAVVGSVSGGVISGSQSVTKPFSDSNGSGTETHSISFELRRQ